MLVLLPQLQKLEGDLDAAVTTGVRDAIIRHLAEWRRLATEVHGLIENQNYADAEAVAQLQRSAVTAATTKSQLLDPGISDLVKATHTVRQ